MLQHYKTQKAKHPDRISAVFVLPAPKKDADWLPLVRDMQVLAQYGNVIPQSVLDKYAQLRSWYDWQRETNVL